MGGFHDKSIELMYGMQYGPNTNICTI
jgi:hypothetical protein